MSEETKTWKHFVAYCLCVFVGLVFGFVAGVTLTLPARHKVTDLNAVSRLRLISSALKHYAAQHEDHLPASLNDLTKSIDTDVVDPLSGDEFQYIGAGRTWGDLAGDGVIAYTDNRTADYQYAFLSSGDVIRVSNTNLTEKLKKVSTIRSDNTFERTGPRPVA